MKTPDYNKNFRRLIYTAMGIAGAIALIGLIISGGSRRDLSISKEIRKIYIVAHDWGGPVAYSYAVAHSQCT